MPDFGSPQNLALGTVSLVSCLVFQVLAKGKAKQLSVLFGLVIGYVVALFMGAVDFSGFAGMQLFALPQLMPFTPEFNLGAIVSVTLRPSCPSHFCSSCRPPRLSATPPRSRWWA